MALLTLIDPIEPTELMEPTESIDPLFVSKPLVSSALAVPKAFVEVVERNSVLVMMLAVMVRFSMEMTSSVLRRSK
jgi:hypothetical protein